MKRILRLDDEKTQEQDAAAFSLGSKSKQTVRVQWIIRSTSLIKPRISKPARICIKDVLAQRLWHPCSFHAFDPRGVLAELSGYTEN